MKQSVFNAYQTYSDEIIAKDETLTKYESDLKEKKSSISNLILTATLFTKLKHPIRLYRTQKEQKRLTNIQTMYQELKDSPLVEHFDEESGYIEEDLNSAATYFKPRRMKEFTKIYPIYREQDKKLLKKKSNN